MVLLASGRVHFQAGELQECLAIAREALDIFNRKSDPEHEADALAMIADVYMERKQFQMVQQYARNASRLYDSAGNKARDAAMRVLAVQSSLRLPEKQQKLKQSLQDANVALSIGRALKDRNLQ